MTMPRSASDGHLKGPSTATALAVAIALGTLLAGAPLAAATSSAPVWAADPVSWTNGLVLCQFASTRPAVVVSALDLNKTGLSVTLGGMDELRGDGSVAAVAELSNATWVVSNLSTDAAYNLSFSVHAPLVAATGPATPIGSVDLRVQFILPVYGNSPVGPTDTVIVRLSVTNWTWQAAGDHLSALFVVSPTSVAAEHLTPTTAAGWLISSDSNSSGQELERMGANSTAVASLASGGPTSISATPTLSMLSPTAATLAVEFGTAAGAFRSLEFTAHVGIVTPPTVLGIPLPELLAVTAAAILVSLLMAASARRLRRRPSDLIYVEEDR